MTSLSCPFCGEIMDSPLKFCVACGRAITETDLKRSSLKLSASSRKSDASRTGVSRRDFSAHRKVRSFMYTVSAVLMVLIGYYFVMKYMLHEHMPGKLDEKIESVVGGASIPGMEGLNSSSSSASSSANSDSAASSTRGTTHPVEQDRAADSH